MDGLVGGVLILVGIVGALMCSRMFRVVGHGTPVPTEPARELIESGPYRYSRNPIYIADLMILVGIALHHGELMLFMYSAVFAVAAQLWVVCHEEPVLERRFGDHYRAYCNAVPRWVGGRGRDRGIV
jgi:protein-S-isoprenylcysteine O-methyltransferase Ste14